MTVKCAASSVGGVGVFTDLDDLRSVKEVSLQVGTETWAKYTPADPFRVKVNKHTGCLILNGKNIIVAIEDINIRNVTNNVTLDLFIIK